MEQSCTHNLSFHVSLAFSSPLMVGALTTYSIWLARRPPMRAKLYSVLQTGEPLLNIGPLNTQLSVADLARAVRRYCPVFLRCFISSNPHRSNNIRLANTRSASTRSANAEHANS
jgi:hypothetical protein